MLSKKNRFRPDHRLYSQQGRRECVTCQIPIVIFATATLRITSLCARLIRSQRTPCARQEACSVPPYKTKHCFVNVLPQIPNSLYCTKPRKNPQIPKISLPTQKLLPISSPDPSPPSYPRSHQPRSSTPLPHPPDGEWHPSQSR